MGLAARSKQCVPGSLVSWRQQARSLVSAVVLATVGLGALGLAKLGIDRLPGTSSWKSDNVTVFVPIGLSPRVDRRDDRGERLSAAMTDATSDADPATRSRSGATGSLLESEVGDGR